MKKITNALIAASLITGAQAATMIAITGDAANSDVGNYGWNDVGNTVSDTGTYDPDNPTAAGFTQLYSNASTPTGWHANDAPSAPATINTGIYTLSYLVTGGFTTSAASPSVALDFYGRDFTFDVTRDNGYTVTLYNGDYSTVIGTPATGQSASDDSAAYNRTVFNLGAGITFDRLQITAPNSGATEAFSVAEVRLASIPEPSSAALLGLGGLALILRRRK